MPEAQGEMLIEIEHPPVTLLVPSPPKRKSVAVPARELGENANNAAAGKVA
jgi:hypothetical protein